MFFLRNKRRDKEMERKEAQIQAIHDDTLKKIDKYTKPAKKLNDYIDKRNDITELIFLATGGQRRSKK